MYLQVASKITPVPLDLDLDLAGCFKDHTCPWWSWSHDNRNPSTKHTREGKSCRAVSK